MSKKETSAGPGRLSAVLPAPWLFLALCLVIIPAAENDNDLSRMASIDSIVSRGTTAIDDSSFAPITIDKVFIDGHYYSDKPPMAAFLGAAVYWPVHQLGLSLEAHPWQYSAGLELPVPQELSLAYFLITLLTVKALWLASLLAFRASLELCGHSRRLQRWGTLALGLGSLHLTWSSVFNNHSLAASALTIGTYFYLRARNGDPGRSMLGAGLFLSLAGTLAVPTALFYAGFFLLVLRDPSLRRFALAYLLPLVVTAVPALAANYAISGSVVPVNIVPEYFDWPGSPWFIDNAASGGLSGVETRSLGDTIKYASKLLFGERGFVWHNPLLFLAAPALFRAARRGQPLAAEATLIGAVSVVLFGYYAVFTSNFSGGSYSIRWLVPVLPLYFLFLPDRLADASPWEWRRFRLLLGIGAGIALLGLASPWSTAPDLRRRLDRVSNSAHAVWGAAAFDEVQLDVDRSTVSPGEQIRVRVRVQPATDLTYHGLRLDLRWSVSEGQPGSERLQRGSWLDETKVDERLRSGQEKTFAATIRVPVDMPPAADFTADECEAVLVVSIGVTAWPDWTAIVPLTVHAAPAGSDH